MPAKPTARTNHENAKIPLHLLLSHTEQQTHDTKTLRFQVLDERVLCVKSGQFLTFQWTIDGRVTRSYTISSSPVHENYLEITPKRMDLELATAVTLLYCVRTGADIIFENELSRLSRSLSNFKYEVCLSRAGPTWKGRSGRLTEEFVSQSVTDLDSPTFFLCGPKGFIDNARQILSTLRVSQGRILQESFGESKPSTESRPLEADCG